jgi:hypothetical protein
MKKESIVQFVSFFTNLDYEDFSSEWDQYAREFRKSADEVHLYEASKKSRNRFRYISLVESKSADFRFSFLKGKKSEHFPEHNVKVVQLGGYSVAQYGNSNTHSKNLVKIMAFLDSDNGDVEFCKQQTFSSLNVYEAYFENCAHSNILEFFVAAKDAENLLAQLATRGEMHAGIYKECPAFIANQV